MWFGGPIGGGWLDGFVGRASSVSSYEPHGWPAMGTLATCRREPALLGARDGPRGGTSRQLVFFLESIRSRCVDFCADLSYA